MKILFTTSNLPFSRLIRWFTGEPCSHCAIQVSPRLVLHSNFVGVHVCLYSNFIKKNEVIHYVDFPAEMEPIDWTKYLGSHYDYLALAWFAIKLIFVKLTLQVPIRKNTWEQRRAFICTELVSELALKEQNSVITPEGLYKKLLSLGGTDI